MSVMYKLVGYKLHTQGGSKKNLKKIVINVSLKMIVKLYNFCHGILDWNSFKTPAYIVTILLLLDVFKGHIIC